MRDYYDARAPEYDDWWMGTGRFAGQERPGWAAEVLGLQRALAALAPLRTLDVACGTGFLTRHLATAELGLVGVDQSEQMLEIARARMPAARFVRSDAFALPFSDAAFDRLFTSHFYGHLEAGERAAFLQESRRLAGELVVADSALRAGVESESVQPRVLNDGSRWQVFKRYFTPQGLLAELGEAGCAPGEVLFAGTWFVAVRVGLA